MLKTPSSGIEDLLEQSSNRDLDLLIPRLAKDRKALAEIENRLAQTPTHHKLIQGDARNLQSIPDSSIHLVVTSPPYWILKEYNDTAGQLGKITDYDEFLGQLDLCWKECFRLLVPSGRLVIVVGDVLLSRRKFKRHQVIPLHADIQVRCRKLGFDNLAPIFWYKIASASYEANGNGKGFLGKPYEPDAVVKHDVEYILMERKPGSYRSPDSKTRLLSVISAENHSIWFRQIWDDVRGESAKQHPAPFPAELASRLIRMFSFVGDTVLDPFVGTGTTMLAAARVGTTMLAAARVGRNSVGVEVDPSYCQLALERLRSSLPSLTVKRTLEFLQTQVAEA